MNHARSYPYLIVARTPVLEPHSVLASRSFAASSSASRISGIHVLGATRFFLRQLGDEQRLPAAYEVRLFGGCSADGSASAGFFHLTDAVASEPSEPRVGVGISRISGVAGGLHSESCFRPGAVFEGRVHTRQESSTPETIGFIASLLSVSRIGPGSSRGFGVVDVCVDSSEIATERLYDDSMRALPTQVAAYLMSR